MLDFTKALDMLKGPKETPLFQLNSKIIPKKDFYDALFAITKDLFGQRRNSIAACYPDGQTEIRNTLDTEIDSQKLLDLIYQSDEALITKPETLEEYISQHDCSLSEDDLLLIYCGMNYLQRHASILDRIEAFVDKKLTSDISILATETACLFLPPKSQEDNHKKYINAVIFIYYIITKLKKFWDSADANVILRYISYQTFFCDLSVIKAENINILKCYWSKYNEIDKYIKTLLPQLKNQIILRLHKNYSYEDIFLYNTIFDSTNNIDNQVVPIENFTKFKKRLNECLKSSPIFKLQKDLASYLNISITTLNYYFTGKDLKLFPSKLAFAFEVTPDYLAGRTDNSAEFIDQQGKISTGTPYRLMVSAFDYSYQQTNTYHKLKSLLKEIPPFFYKQKEIIDLENALKTISFHLPLRINDFNRYFDDLGNDLNPEKIDKINNLLSSFNSDNQAIVTELTKNYDTIAKIVTAQCTLLNIYTKQESLNEKAKALETEIKKIVFEK